jgi:hypothetical protein
VIRISRSVEEFNQLTDHVDQEGKKMLRKKSALMSALAATVAVGFAGVASAQVGLNLNELAAAEAIPFVTQAESLIAPMEDEIRTTAVITNGASFDRIVHFHLINGDPFESWDDKSWQCELTARETVAVLIENDGAGGSTITFECDAEEGNDNAPFAGNPGSVSSDAERGILWVTVRNTLGQSTRENVLFADFTIENASAGEAASAAAAAFQSTNSTPPSNFVFDGNDLSTFPDSLAVNYLPPNEYPGSLLVYTLDGTTGHAPHVKVNVDWYDNDEFKQNDEFTFDCFDVINYGDVASGLDTLESEGHMELAAGVTVPTLNAAGTPHDTDGRRRTPFLCYNMQDAPGGGTTLRPCAQSTASFTADDDDVPNLSF